MHTNIRAVIHVYKTGQILSDETVYFTRVQWCLRPKEIIEMNSHELRIIFAKSIKFAKFDKTLAGGAYR